MMKKITDITKRKPVNEAAPTTSVSSDSINYSVFTSHIEDGYVYKDEKLSKLAVLFKHQLNKRCGTNFRICPLLYGINGVESVLLRDGKKAVGIMPFSKNSNYYTLFYYDNFDIKSNSNTALFSISSEKVGVVEMLSVFVLFVRNASVVNGETIHEAINIRQNANDGSYSITTTNKNYDGTLKQFKNNCKTNMKNCGKVELYDNYDVYMAHLVEYIKETGGRDINDLAANIRRFAVDVKTTPYDDAVAKVKDFRDFYNLFMRSTENIIEIVLTVCACMAFDKSANSVMVVEHANLTETKQVDAFNGLTEDEIKREEDKIQAQKDYIRGITRTKMKFVLSTKSEKLALIKKNIPQVAFIIGKGGVGKTSIVKNVLRNEFGMKDLDASSPGKWYAELGGGQTNAESLYNFFWKHNGKFLLLDDCANLFEGKYNIAFWKHLIPGETSDFGALVCPKSSDMDGTTSTSRYYDPKLTVGDMRKRYYLEVGRMVSTKKKDGDENTKFIKKIPSSFKFTGAVMIIANDKFGDYKKLMGANHWAAIKSRIDVIDYSPASWYIKRDIFEKLDAIAKGVDSNGVPFKDPDMSPIPQEYAMTIKEMIDEISQIEGHDNVNYRVLNRLSGAIEQMDGFNRIIAYDVIFEQTDENND